MTIIFNNNQINIEHMYSLTQLLNEFGYHDKGFAVMLNQQFIPRIKYDDIFIKELDKIDILRPMQGG